jgi:L-rhamnose-H+ transport protein
MNAAIGTLICALGGIAGATFALPFRSIKSMKYESYWFIYALFGLVVFPLVLSAAFCPQAFDIICSSDKTTILRCVGFGALWGLGGLTWGLMIRYLGIGLGLAIGCGLCSATGTLIPPLVTGKAAELIKDAAAIVTLSSVGISLFGIILVGLAGKSKEGELDEESKKKAVAEFNFKKGILVALFSGVASAGMNFGLQGGISLESAAILAGVDSKWVGMPVLVVVLWGGFAVNAIWCLVQNFKNRTFADYKKPCNAWFLAALAGVIWAMQFACQKIGEPAMGEIRYISFAVVMGSCVLFSSVLGVFLGEWNGTSKKTRCILACGLTVLAISILTAVAAKMLFQ